MKLTNEMKSALKVIWDYTGLDMEPKKCDLILGCGCANLEILRLLVVNFGKQDMLIKFYLQVV